MAKLTYAELLEHFPHRSPRQGQVDALNHVARHDGNAVLELPTGIGKTAVGLAFLRTLQTRGEGQLFYVTTTKALVDQIAENYPGVTTAYGRHEYECIYPDYVGGGLRADEIPCLTLVDCPHRVDMETGETHEPGVARCPYYDQKYTALQGGIVVCTSAFYLFNQFLRPDHGQPAGLVIDEAHRLARMIRNSLSYEITDYHLRRSADLLAVVDREAAQALGNFRRRMVAQMKRKPAEQEVLLEDDEIRKLIGALEELDQRGLQRSIRAAVRSGVIDPVAERETLTQLERITADLVRYVRALSYSLPSGERHPLNYTFGYYKRELEGEERAQYRLVVKSYYVAPLIKRMLGKRTVAYSATIGDPIIFGRFISGIEAPFLSAASDFPARNTRVFVPTDTPDLAHKRRKPQDLTRVLRRIVRACVKFAGAGHRSLVLVVSEDERSKFLRIAEEEGLDVLSYGNGYPARQAAADFRNGQSQTLLGTMASFGEGVDLPDRTAPVTFVLRPAYPRPSDPQTIFEERRFGSKNVWSIRQWEVMNDVLQARGRNVRSKRDVGVTFLVSRQFGGFAQGAMPRWLDGAFRGMVTFDQAVNETLALLGG